MKKFKNSKIGKYFLYTLLCICIFAAITLLGCFVAGNTNVLEWQSSGRMGVVVASAVICFHVIFTKELFE